MEERYRVRSTRTRADSTARRAADIAVILVICAGLVTVLFTLMLVPLKITTPKVNELEPGDLVLVDRVMKFVSDYSVGDIVVANTEEGREVLRIAAFGGSEYLVSGGRAYLNDALVDESSYSAEWGEGAELFVSVPEGSILLLPDDRAGVDSLEGFIFAFKDVFGEVRFRVSPISKLTLFY